MGEKITLLEPMKRIEALTTKIKTEHPEFNRLFELEWRLE